MNIIIITYFSIALISSQHPGEHVMRKSDEDWVKKSMEYRVESRKPVVWKRICQNFRSAEKMPMTGRRIESML